VVSFLERPKKLGGKDLAAEADKRKAAAARKRERSSKAKAARAKAKGKAAKAGTDKGGKKAAAGKKKKGEEESEEEGDSGSEEPESEVRGGPLQGRGGWEQGGACQPGRGPACSWRFPCQLPVTPLAGPRGRRPLARSDSRSRSRAPLPPWAEP
jgi:hypothetical protein